MIASPQILLVPLDALSVQKIFSQLIKMVGTNTLWNINARAIQDYQDENLIIKMILLFLKINADLEFC